MRMSLGLAMSALPMATICAPGPMWMRWGSGALAEA
jgi:hypothetical protein